MPSHPGPLLLVDDSPEDRETTLRAFDRAGLPCPVHCCEDGEEALDYLLRRGRYAEPARAPRPAIVVLDLNLPGTDGREVLARLKADPDLCTIPIVVLTTSTHEKDIAGCYESGANSYLHKAVGVEEFFASMACFTRYWFGPVVLPHGPR